MESIFDNYYRWGGDGDTTWVICEIIRTLLFENGKFFLFYKILSVLPANVQKMTKYIGIMTRNCPGLSSGAPYILQGMFQLNAPKPFRNVDKAMECFMCAYQVGSTNMYACIYVYVLLNARTRHVCFSGRVYEYVYMHLCMYV